MIHRNLPWLPHPIGDFLDQLSPVIFLYNCSCVNLFLFIKQLKLIDLQTCVSIPLFLHARQLDLTPRSISRIVPGLDGDFFSVHKCHVRSCDHSRARIPVHRTINCNLLHAESADTCLFLKFSPCSLFQIFSEIDKSSRKRPESDTWMVTSLYKEYLKRIDISNLLFHSSV